MRHGFVEVWWSIDMILTQNVLQFGPAENRRRFMKVKDNLDLDEFLTEVGVVKIEIFSNQTELDAIYQLGFTSSFFPTTHYLNPNTI